MGPELVFHISVLAQYARGGTHYADSRLEDLDRLPDGFPGSSRTVTRLYAEPELMARRVGALRTTILHCPVQVVEGVVSRGDETPIERRFNGGGDFSAVFVPSPSR